LGIIYMFLILKNPKYVLLQNSCVNVWCELLWTHNVSWQFTFILLRLMLSQSVDFAYPISAYLRDAIPLLMVSQPHPVVTLTWRLQQGTFPINSGPILLLFI
jgi:hypothetical protein